MTDKWKKSYSTSVIKSVSFFSAVLKEIIILIRYIYPNEYNTEIADFYRGN